MERKRAVKTSEEQYKIYIDFCLNNPIMRHGRLTPSDNPKELDAKWIELVQQLNSCGSGPHKDVKGWKTVFTEWKSNVKRKARLLFAERQKTGGGTSSVKPLTDLEQQLITLIGEVVIVGLEGVADSFDLTAYATTSYSQVAEQVEKQEGPAPLQGPSSPQQEPPTPSQQEPLTPLLKEPPTPLLKEPPTPAPQHATPCGSRRRTRYEPYDATLLQAFREQQQQQKSASENLHKKLDNIHTSLLTINDNIHTSLLTINETLGKLCEILSKNK